MANKHTVKKGSDGFWRVSGQPETSYYTDEATAVRVAGQLDAKDVADAKEAAEKAKASGAADDTVEG